MRMVSNRVEKDRRRLLTLSGQRENVLDEARVHQTQEVKALVEEETVVDYACTFNNRMIDAQIVGFFRLFEQMLASDNNA